MFKVGQKVTVNFAGETRQGFIAKDLADEELGRWLVRLDYAFDHINKGKRWLKVGKQFAHEVLS